MKASIHISLVFLISGLMACSTPEKKSLLEERAGYGVPNPQMNLNGSGGVHYVPSRVPEKVSVAWLHAHELPSKDYFWGSWISIVVALESWEMVKVDVPKSENQKMKTEPRPSGKKSKKR